jgi:hypothetical protein
MGRLNAGGEMMAAGPGGFRGRTVTVTVARSVPTEAVTVVAPLPTAVTMPSRGPTLAIAGLADDHSTVAVVGRP